MTTKIAPAKMRPNELFFRASVVLGGGTENGRESASTTSGGGCETISMRTVCCGARGAIARPSLTHAASSSANARAEGNRSAGDFARARSTAASSLGGSGAGSKLEGEGGARVAWANASAMGWSSSNGTRRVSSSNNTRPTA